MRWKGSNKRLRANRRKLEEKLIKIREEGRHLRPTQVSEAIRGRTGKWTIDGGGFKDPIVFLDVTTPAVERLINGVDSVGKKVHTSLRLKLVRSDPSTGTKHYTIVHFRSKTHNIISEEDTTTEYQIMKEKMLESFAKYQNKGSGWALDSIEGLDIFITKYKPMRGKSWKPLPDVIKNKKAIINPENGDDECFKWAFTIADNIPGKDNTKPGRITKIVKKQSEKYDWSGLEFPVKLKDIHIFEKKNTVNIHVPQLL